MGCRLRGNDTVVVVIAAKAATHVPLFLTCAALLCCVACGDQKPKASSSSVRDSAGIAIVDNKSPMLVGDQAWKIDTSTVLRIDGARYPLVRVASAFRLTDGRIVVADQRSNLLLIFDKNGARADTLGSEGDGPHEFRYLYRAFPGGGDSILVSDGERKYVAVIPINGGTWRQLPIEEFPMVVNGVFSNGSLFMVPGMVPALRSDGSEKQWVDSSSFDLANSQGKPKGKIGPFPTGITFTSPTTMGTLVFGPTGYAEVGGPSLFVAWSQEYSIKVFTDDKVLTRIIRRNWTPAAVTIAHIAAWKERMLSGLTGTKAQEMQQEVAGSRFAEQHPAHAEIRSDRVGNLWVKEYKAEDELPLWHAQWGSKAATRWSVFDTTGRWVTDITLPPRFQPTDIGNAYIVGVSLDADDVETVRVLTLHKSEGK